VPADAVAANRAAADPDVVTTEKARLEKAVRDAEAELDAAKTFTAVKAAAKRLQRAKAELKELEAAERQKPKPTRGTSSRDAAS